MPDMDGLEVCEMIRDRVSCPILFLTARIEDADKVLRQRITPRTLEHIVDLVPDEWLEYEGTDMSVREVRDVYKKFLTERLKNSQIFVKQAEYARQALI